MPLDAEFYELIDFSSLSLSGTSLDFETGSYQFILEISWENNYWIVF